MQEQTSGVFEQVMAQCARGCFTGLLRVRAREGSGEVRFLSGMQDGVRFAAEEGDAALARLQAASDVEFEAISSLPPMEQDGTEPVPPEGVLQTFHAAQLMRYCESNSLTCALELDVDGKILTARYRLGELLSVEPDSEQTSKLAEAKHGKYRFRLPRFELPASVPQRRAAPKEAAKPAAAPVPVAAAVSPAPVAAARVAVAAAPSTSRGVAPAPFSASLTAKPAAAAPIAAKPAATPAKVAPAPAAPLPAAPSPVARASATKTPASSRDAISPTPIVPAVAARAAAEPGGAAPSSRSAGSPARTAPAEVVPKDLPRPAAAPVPAAPAAAPAFAARPAAVVATPPAVAKPASAPGVAAAARVRQDAADAALQPPPGKRSRPRYWVAVAMALAAAALAGWVALGSPMPWPG
jgi:hypothetical protein